MSDKGTVIGLATALLCILGAAVIESGGVGILMALVNLPSFMIVMGGTLGTVTASFPLDRVTQMGKIIGVAFRQDASSERALVSLFVKLADRARREGLLALETEAAQIEDHSIKKGVMLVVDGTDPELVREIMESDVAAMSERHQGKFAMFEAAGGFAPTMGIRSSATRKKWRGARSQSRVSWPCRRATTRAWCARSSMPSCRCMSVARK